MIAKPSWGIERGADIGILRASVVTLFLTTRYAGVRGECRGLKKEFHSHFKILRALRGLRGENSSFPTTRYAGVRGECRGLKKEFHSHFKILRALCALRGENSSLPPAALEDTEHAEIKELIPDEA